MPNITTCTGCGELYEACSEEAANEPSRLCRLCRMALSGDGGVPCGPVDDVPRYGSTITDERLATDEGEGPPPGDAYWEGEPSVEHEELVDPRDECDHDWNYTGTQYGGDDERYHGEGRVLCRKCGADGDG